MPANGLLPGPVGEVRSMTTAGGGNALTTTPSFVEMPDGAAYVFLNALNFAGGAGVVKLAKCPYLLIVKTTDKLAVKANATDYSGPAQDARAGTSVDLSAMGAVASNAFLYVGAAQPFRGVAVVNANANANASVLTVNYWNGVAWTNIVATDGTAAAGATMAQNGNVTWTIPSDWTTATLAALESAGLVPNAAMTGVFWTRWEVSVALSAAVKNSKMVGMNRDTAYEELLASVGGIAEWSERVFKGFGGFAAIEALTDAGTANIEGNVASLAGFGFANN